MCGIAGAFWTSPQHEVSAEVLTRMTDSIAHRGPDDSGIYHRPQQEHGPYGIVPGIGLGHRRLSIIDLAGGHQPLANEDETVWTVFNGEIFNFKSLRARLEGAGHTFRTDSDTEVIVHLFEDEGVDAFRHFNGMFAIAVWDQRHRRIVLGRDRLGQKPLYFRVQDDQLLFGSELKAILQAPGVPREVDPGAIDAYLTYQYVPHPRTIFKGIHKLPPGCYLTFDGQKLEVVSYWNPDFTRESNLSLADAKAELIELFTDSVRLRLQADVPLGAFLSGGIDSSLVVATMKQLTDQPVKTFSIGFPQKDYDETSYARLVAEHLGTEHHEFQVTPDAVEILPKLIHHYDEPMADSSAIPTWYVSQMTREHVTVALSGDGGDELFAGYDRYKAVRLAAMLDKLGPLGRLASRLGMKVLPAGGPQKSILRRGYRFAEAMSLSPARRYLDWISIFNETRRSDLYDDAFVAQLPDADPYTFLYNAWKRVGRRDPLTAASLADLTTYLPCDLNTKVDIAAMANALECRQPFLDYRLAEFAIRLPAKWKWRGGRGKFLLKHAFGDRLPKVIWNRKKMGFGVPLNTWFRGQLKEILHDTLLSETSLSRGYFQPEAVKKLLDEHDQNQFDHSARLWALLVLELWHREWVDGHR
ncbi:asparagine synthase (glutamine-hydrolyzing) [Blastopirellula marina]|uniref:asparagine synthase (glutamine-hydrolyzing) n=1 Tax=Blastopirellula marina TaxID=124 RepID=A0A2S8FHU8_9BACT|nr:asparagine synthase (glutamine-hydrolyzing) [Blastopirellula marina]PQO31723.1 asparagine synthase (glutamine-hydrolyzing) [Blastopirellula marina]PTL43030.1 asparagine synthase (glutamine-hydrolyzing) [Blastopirellula marina]